MKIIKLDAIDSTNSFLKELALHSDVENYTVVVTKSQTKGRGQQEGYWLSEPSKNLTFSVFIKDLNLKVRDQKFLNFAVSLSIFQVLDDHKISRLSIKWPNDIMAVNNKLCGVLIENNLQKNKIKSTVIGIGLNVNQTNFPEDLRRASSLKLETGKHFDLNDLLSQLLKCLEQNLTFLISKKYDILEKNYLSKLYKKDQIATFRESQNNQLFNGIIIGISKSGNLQIQLENDEIREYGLKEVSFA